MKNVCLLFLFCLILFSCDNINYSKDNHIKTFKLDDNLYKERYNIYSGGAIGGDVCSVYLTDSISFRKYLGKEFDNEQINVFLINSKAVLIYKIDLHTYELLESSTYKISELQQEGKFE